MLVSADHLNVIRDEVQRMSAYHVPPSTGMVKLDAMENPYPLPQEMRNRIAAALSSCEMNRYPDPRSTRLKQTLREAMRIPEGFDILLGNGSDELIQILILACARSGACVLAPAPTFVMYRQYALLAGMEYHAVDLAPDFGLATDAMSRAIREYQPAIIFLSYPNNPTGNLFDAAALEALIEEAPGLVVIDEAYQPFAEASFMDRLGRYPNLLILRTVSKLGLAGIRLGYLVGAPAWLREFDKVRSPYNVNVLTQEVAQVALGNFQVLLDQAEMIRDERGRLQAGLAAIEGVQCHASRANFLLARVPDARVLCDALLQRRILVKSLHGAHPLLEQCIRVTVGTPDENDALLAAMREVLQPPARGAGVPNRVV